MKSVLIVDNDELLRGALQAALENARIEVDSAKDGKEGLAKAKKIKPAIIVVDENMSKVVDHNFVERLRKTDWGKEIALIVLTTQDSRKNTSNVLKPATIMQLYKPSISAKKLVAMIKTYLQKL